ncbi:MAG: hypothetical protein ACWA44_03510 [Thiotrichales bacterium]
MSQLFTQTIIAMVWDFDKTLIPGYMQAPLFAKFGVDESAFWQEVNKLPEHYKRRGVEQISTEVLYLNHILEYVRLGRFAGLTNAMLKELGAELTFYQGLPDLFSDLDQLLKTNPEFQHHGLTLEHYVVSTGLTQMIRGSRIAPYLDGVWGCELLEAIDSDDQTLTQLGYVLDNTTKTRAVFEINKGTNKVPEIDVNAQIAEEDRRIPVQNMIYLADGPSDVPVFSVIKKLGGRTYGVYGPGKDKEFKQVNQLLQQGRISAFGPADYRQGSQTHMWLSNAVQEIAERICSDRERVLGEKIGVAPKHLND